MTPWHTFRRFVGQIGPALRATLLRFLEAPADERAELIGRLHQREDGQLLGELLVELEVSDWGRQAATRTARPPKKRRDGDRGQLTRTELRRRFPALRGQHRAPA